MGFTVLVPLDGSALAERALPYARALLRGGEGTLVLVRATLAFTRDGTVARDTRAVVERAESEMELVVEPLRRAGLAVVSRVYYDEAAAAIQDAVARWHADAVVMSTHGRSGLGRWLFGSVADRMLQRAEVPLLLVPAGCERTWSEAGPRDVVVPLDGSEFAEAGLAAVRTLPPLQDAALHLVRIVEPPAPLEADGAPYLPPYENGVATYVARDYLEAFATLLRPGGRQVTVETAVGEPVSLITSAARHHQADLIAMATHGRGGLARLVLGSVATGVLQRAAAPLLLVRPLAVRRATADTPARVEPTAAPVTLSLTPHELALVRQGLRTWLTDAEREAGARADRAEGARAIADTLALLEQAETPIGGPRS